jgi:radical SAM superfamily enzyme YgiQ (UPF0313 family)
MKICFIRPRPHIKGIDTKGLSFIDFPSLSFPTLAAHTPPHHSITMIDERYEKIDFNVPCDLIGITAMTSEVTRAYEIADEYRKRGTTVVLGGPHASALPHEAKTHADSVVIGEAEESWPRLLHDLEHNELQPFYQQTLPTDIRMTPIPDISLISRHMLYGGVQSSRGCPHGCKFCCIGNSKDGKVFRKRPIDHVIQEIRKNKQRIIMFYDSSMTIDPEHTKTLFRVLRGIHKRFICLGNIDILAQDDELLHLSKEAGCIQWNIGFESISQESLHDAKKKTNRVHEYTKAIEKIHAHKMSARGFFIFGFDHDTPDIFENTWEFIQASHLDSANFALLTPFPGTPLFKDLENQHRILTTDWDEYGYHRTVVFQPKILTKTELLNGYKSIYQKYYSWSAIAKRFHHLMRHNITVSNLLIFLIENIFIRAHFIYYNRRKNQ